MRLKKLAALVMACALSFSVIIPSAQAKERKTEMESDVLYDDFEGDSLDTDKWLIAHKRWGGKNGGVVKENVSVSDGTLKLEGHGLQYEGDIPGIGRDDGKLTGAAIATKEYYASGSYEVVAKIAPDLGACSALWTFEYEEYYPGQEGFDPKYATYGYCTVNHEIDIEIPTGTHKNPDPNFSSARFNTYVRENDYTPHYHDLGFALNDGKFHTYRFDWHTGDDNEIPRVEFYIDDNLMYTSYTDIPTNEGRFWIGLWFPYAIDSDKDGKEDTGWSGLADFDTTVFEIDSVKITPFHEAGDTEQHETYAYDGWAENSFPELAEKENYEHIVNGDFSNGATAWNLDGKATIADGMAYLSSGQVADSVSQMIDVVPCGSYTITADVVTDGTKVTIGACKENGGNNQGVAVSQSGKVSVTFNNDTVNPTLKIYAKVDRWQGSDAKVTVDNISVKGASYVDEIKVDFIPLGEEEEVIETPTTEATTEETTEATTEEITEATTEEIPEVTTEEITEATTEIITTEEEVEPEVSKNLIVDGTLSHGDEFWKVSGSTRFLNGKAYLASGRDTDTISQKVSVEKGETYTLSADIKSSGAEIELGVNDYNGRYTKLSEKYTKDGRYSLTFKVADHIDTIEVVATVLRYQGILSDCSIDNIVLVKGTVPGGIEEEKPEVGEEQVPVDEKTEITALNLLASTSFSASAWKLSGSASIMVDSAILASGKDTDTISQVVALEPNTTYVFYADVVTSGATVDLKVLDYDGKYSEITESVDASGLSYVEFTTGKNPKEVKLKLQVLRYQDNKDACAVPFVALIKKR